jgi:hypothetical protein
MVVTLQNQNDQNTHEHDDEYDDMPKVDKISLVTNALSLPLTRPWVPSDGEGSIDNQDAWRVVEPYIEEQPIPPNRVKLSDIQVFKIFTNKSITADNRYENWPFDFALQAFRGSPQLSDFILVRQLDKKQ